MDLGNFSSRKAAEDESVGRIFQIPRGSSPGRQTGARCTSKRTSERRRRAERLRDPARLAKFIVEVRDQRAAKLEPVAYMDALGVAKYEAI